MSGPTRLKRALTVTLKQQVKQIPDTDNDSALKHKQFWEYTIVKKRKIYIELT